MPKNVVIVGMARSGTSLSAAIFAGQGYFMGESAEAHIRHGDDHNPFGYFEADDLISANVDVLQRSGFASHNTWLFESISPESVRQVSHLLPMERHRRLVERYEANKPWLWKDPRLCFTLAYWWKLLDRSNTAVVMIHRDPEQIYRSFRRMGWCPSGDEPRQELIRRCHQHLRAGMETVESLGIPHIVVDYTDYLAIPDVVARRLSDFCELELSARDLNVRHELNHSGGMGRISAYARIHLSKLPPGLLTILARIIPSSVQAVVLPERKYVKRDGR